MKHKQRKEPMEFPLLEVIAFPADENAVSIVIPAEFEVTGEIMMSLGSRMPELEETKRLLEHIVNRIADMMLEEKKKQHPPFVPTGRLNQKEQPSE